MPPSKKRSADAVRFGAVMNRLRRERGWTLVRLAAKMNMNPTYLGVLEAGKNMVSLDTLLELAEVFGVEAAEIVREVEQARKPVLIKLVTQE
jgi:transcriptional regulator with XRE-family HTH domain